MSSALIVGAAPQPDAEAFYRSLLAEAALVIAADAAGEWCCGLGRVPDVVLGDMDSAEPGAVGRLQAAGSRVVVLDRAKDLSDLDACVEEASRLGCHEVVVTAAFRERPDHTLAAFGTLLRASQMLVRAVEPGWEATLLDAATRPTCDLAMTPGTTFSVLALEAARGVTIEGGAYRLTRGSLEPLSSLGISNVATGEAVSVTVEQGSVLLLALKG